MQLRDLMGRAKGKKGRQQEAAKKLRNTLGMAGAAVAIAALLVLGVVALGAEKASAAPVWLATTIEGEQIGSDQFKGDVYVMDFFFLTCGICEIQLPQNKAMIDALAGREDFHFISITADPADTVPLIRKHQVEDNATWPHVRDTFGLYQKFQARGNPNLVFVDREGNVALTVTDLASSQYLLEQAQRLLDGEQPSKPGVGDTRPAAHAPTHSTSTWPAFSPSSRRSPSCSQDAPATRSRSEVPLPRTRRAVTGQRPPKSPVGPNGLGRHGRPGSAAPSRGRPSATK